MNKMIKKTLLTALLILGCLLGARELRGQTTIQIGSGTYYVNYIPTNATKSYSYTQQIYTENEIGGSGTISSIAFYAINYNATRNLDVYLVNTTKESFSSNYDWITTISDSDKVFSGNVTFEKDTWTSISVGSFTYTGNNLAVIINDKTGSANTNAPRFYYYSNTPTYRGMYASSDDAAYDPSNPGAGNRNYNTFNQIKMTIAFDYQRPTELTVAGITNNTASITWTAPTASTGHTLDGYQYRIKAGSGSYSDPVTTTNPCNLTNLASTTTYTFQVRAIYSDNSKETHYSTWAETSFTTDCDDRDIPTELWDFEELSTGTSTVPDCWQIKELYNSYPNVYYTSTESHSGTKVIRFTNGNSSQTLLMPAIEKLSGNTLTFYAKTNTSSGTHTITVGYYNSLGVFEPIKSFDISNAYPSDPYEAPFINLDDVKKVAIKGYNSTGHIYLDDVQIIATPSSCTPVSSPSYGTVTYNSAQLSWTAVGSETNWKLQYKVSGAGSWTTVNVSSANLVAGVYTLTGLSENTTYEWQVAAWCDTSDDDDISTPVAGDDFTTPAQYPAPTGLTVDNITSTSARLSWTAGDAGQDHWDIYYSTSSTAPTGSTDPSISNTSSNPHTITGLTSSTTYYAWVRGNYNDGEHYSVWSEVASFMTPISLPYSYDFEDESEFNYWAVETSTYLTTIINTEAHSSSHCFRFYSSGSTSQYLYSPVLNASTHGVHVEFYYKNQSNASITKLQIGYSTDGSTFSWPEGAKLDVNNNTYLKFQYDFEYSDIKQIAIQYNRNDTYLSVYIDDISFSEVNNKFTTAGNWNTTANWSYGTLPTASDNVTINAACTIPNDCTAEANDITIGSGSLTIADGGQLICNNTVYATIHKTIAGHDGSADKGWHFIASPVADDIDPVDVDELINATAANYDLYRFNQNPDQVINGNPYAWENYKAHTDGFNLTNGQGYLYANANGADLIFTGEINPGTSNTYSVLLAYSGEASTKGWNLVGNPFTCNATLDYPCYTISDDGRWANASGSGTTIAPGTGVMVRTTEGGQSVTFTKAPNTTPDASSNSNSIQLVLSQTINHRGTNTTETLDNAIVSFNQGSELSKFYFGTQNANIYIPQNGKEFAIVSAGQEGQIPLNFRARVNGQYTLTFTSPLTSSLSSLTLIDNLTGAHVDLLQTPSYTFQGNTTDISARFRLLFTTTGVDENDDESQTDFAFISDGQLIVNGTGTLYVYDALGRQVSVKQVTPLTSTLSPLTPGVYVLQLVEGNNVRTQKIIVK